MPATLCFADTAVAAVEVHVQDIELPFLYLIDMCTPNGNNLQALRMPPVIIYFKIPLDQVAC
jgi:hypothetical protein